MHNIVNLKKILPLKLDRTQLDLLTYKDIDWYINTIKTPFFNEYIDYKFLDVTDTELKFKLTNLAMSYSLNMRISGEARLILRDKVSGDKIGGCTLFESDNTSLEIGYWILPAYQNKGYAKELMSNIIEQLFKLKNIKVIRLVIREDNFKSIMLAEKCGFSKSGSFIGKYKENLVYEVRQLK